MFKKITSTLKRKSKYFLAIPLLIKNISNWYDIFLLYFRFKQNTILKLKNGMRFKITHYLDALTIKEIIVDNEYSQYENFDKPKVIVDIGSNIGTFSIQQSILYPESKIYAFEPSETTKLLLETNIKLNKARNIITSRNAITGDKGSKNIYISSASGLSSLYNRIQNTKKEKVNTITLSDIINDNKINSCDLLKIDCEGSEYEILFNTPPNIFNRIKNIVLEYHDKINRYCHNDLVIFLKKQGYRIKIKKHYAESNIGIIFATKENKPIVSVIVPVFKRFRLAKQTIKSILSQKNIDLEDIEIIVCDDEKNVSNKSQYKSIYSKIIYLKNRYEEGPGGNRQTGLEKTHGKYVVFLDSDDMFKSYFLSDMIAWLRQDLSANGIVCFSNTMFENNINFKKKLKLHLLMFIRDFGIFLGYFVNNHYVFKTSFYLCQVSHMIFRRNSILNLRFNYDYRMGGEDWDFISKVIEKGNIRILPKHLLVFRYSSGSQSDTKITKKLKWKSYLLLLSRLPIEFRRGVFYKLFKTYISAFMTRFL